MTDANHDSTEGGGLVQKLLFPGFAGANDSSFLPTNKEHDGPNPKTTPEPDEDDDDGVSHCFGSEASTQVHHNLSNGAVLDREARRISDEKKQPDETTTCSPRLSPRPERTSTLLNNHPSSPCPPPPPFFASTRPHTVVTAPHGNSRSPTASPSPRGPPSPPKLPRRVQAYFASSPEKHRSSSNVASVGETDPKEKPETKTEVSTCEDNQKEEVVEEKETWHEARSGDDDGHVGREGAVPNQKERPWEEEATPEQTAFGKKLLLARSTAANNKSDGAEVLSTESEMGSLVGAATGSGDDRLADVQDMMVQAGILSDGSPKSRKEETLPYSKPVWDDNDDDDDLALPILDNTRIDSDAVKKKKPIQSDSDIPVTNGENEKQDKTAVPAAEGGTTSSILSNAIRRLGSGLSRGSVTVRNSLSAPSTPRPDLPPSPSPPRLDFGSMSQQSPTTPVPTTKDEPGSGSSSNSTPLSFLLRSPGSAAFVAAHSSNNNNGRGNNSSKPSLPSLSPRFSSWNSYSNQRDTVSSSPRRKLGQRERPLHLPSFAGIPENEDGSEAVAPAGNVAPANKTIPFQIARSCFSFDGAHYDTSMDDEYEVAVSNAADVFEYPSFERDRRVGSTTTASPNRKDLFVRNSKSWDVNGVSQASMFRSAPQAGGGRIRRRPGDGVISSTTNAFPPHSPQRASTSSSRVRINSDFSPKKNSDAVELKTPQRIEIEREDALDILACLVERGVSFHHESSRKDLSEDDKRKSDDAESEPVGLGSSFDLSCAVDELRELSEAKRKNEGTTVESNSHKQRMFVLDELQRSHEYSLEMRRASLSASSWLKSIGRADPKETEQGRLSPPPVAGVEATKITNSVQTAGEEAGSETIDVLTLKAKLHSAHLEAKEKAEQAEQLNIELAKCRAEIGRLKSAAQTATFTSPNRSILDETHDSDESSEGSEAVDESFDTTASPFLGELSGFLDSSFLREADVTADSGAGEQVTSLRGSLDEANVIIRRLHGMLKESGQLGDLPEDPPVVEDAAGSAGKHRESPGNKDEQTVNVRMLNAENFSTEYDEQSLPPPPDHGLRSPIVRTVLERWTSDPGLHESLLAWFDDVLAGGDASSIRPLTVSNLDHEVRDGFIMHLFPLLLRRPDIRVDVKMRAHRRTTYDLALSVENIHHPAMMNVRRNLETTSARSDVGAPSVTHSSTTALISNGVVNPSLFTGTTSSSSPSDGVNEAARPPGLVSQLSYDEMTDDIPAHQAQPGLMSALGGALGGLLTRRGGKQEDVHSDGGSMAVGMEPRFDLDGGGGFDRHDDEDAREPYHRVVSAPPGRIGVTFVEYRGHAMVSDVAPDSPLGGWIFPNDILIAIDELPVSGMRVRDIIKVLKDRSERQRALRIVSSHAMNEFAVNQSAIEADTPG